MADFYLLLLLLLPLPVPEHPHPYLTERLIRLATDLDLSTPAENWEQYPLRMGIPWVRQALLELADCPPSSDAARFPSADVAHAQLSVGWAYLEHLDHRAAFTPAQCDGYDILRAETRCRLEVWRAVSYLAGTVKSKRQALQALQALLGPDDYHAGRLPPVLPLERMGWR